MRDLRPWIALPVALILTGCTLTPDYLNPIEWIHGVSDKMQGIEEIEAGTEPPPPVPGKDAPFPKLGSVPEEPPRAIIASEMAAIADDLAMQRTNALFIDAVSRSAGGSAAPSTVQGVAVDPRMVRIGFADGSAEIPASADRAIAAFAKRLLRNDAAHAQLRGFARPDSTNDDPSDAARKLSLARAFAVRAALVDRGVAITRVAVKALGDSREDGPVDGVDAIVIE